MTLKRKALLLTLATATLAIAGGCGSSSSSSSAKKNETALALLRSLKRAGLPIGGYVNYTAATDENHLLGRPGEYVHKVNFHDTRVAAVAGFDIDGGGSIETFKSEADAKKRYGYVHSISSSGSPIFAEYEYRKGTVLLRLSHYLTPNQAAEYKRALSGG